MMQLRHVSSDVILTHPPYCESGSGVPVIDHLPFLADSVASLEDMNIFGKNNYCLSFSLKLNLEINREFSEIKQRTDLGKIITKTSPSCKKINRKKNFDVFRIFVRNLDCGYTSEPPRRGGSNEYPQCT